MRLLLGSLALLASLGLACGGANDGAGGDANDPPAANAGGASNDEGAQNGAGDAAEAKIPEHFYLDWRYQNATLYQKGKEPIVQKISGAASFGRDLRYEQAWTIGQYNNNYQGRYTVDGPDPRVEGAFFITTYDDREEKVFTFSVAAGNSAAMTLTVYDDAGEPELMYGLGLTK